jgi:hypothetical protein
MCNSASHSLKKRNKLVVAERENKEKYSEKTYIK